MLESCRSFAVEWAQEQFSRYLQQLQQVLLRGAMDATHDAEQLHLHKCQRRLARHAQDCRQHFLQSLQQQLAKQQPDRDSPPDYTEASHRALSALLQQHCGAPGLALGERLAVRRFVSCCYRALQLLEFEGRTEAFALGIFQQQFGNSLEGLYRELTVRVESTVAAGKHSALASWVSHVRQQLEDQSLSAANRSLARARLKLLRRQLELNPPVSASALSERWNNPYPEEHCRAELSDRQLMDEANELFQPLRGNPTLPDDVRLLVNRLHPIIIETALTDRQLFLNPLHPARQLLDHLIATVKHWPRNNAAGRQQLLTTLGELAERAARRFKGNPELFLELNRDFAAHCERHAIAAADAEGSAEPSQVREHISRLLDQKTAGGDYAPAVLRLLDYWRQVILHHWARCGADSDAYRQAVARVDDFLWYVRPHPNWDDKKRARDMGPQLEQAIREGFADIGESDSRASEHVAALHKLWQRASLAGTATAAASAVE